MHLNLSRYKTNQINLGVKYGLYIKLRLIKDNI